MPSRSATAPPHRSAVDGTIEAALLAAVLVVTATTVLNLVGVPGRLVELVPAFADRDRAWVVLLWICTAIAGCVAYASARWTGGLPRWTRRLARVGAVAGLALIALLSVWQDPPWDLRPELWTGFSPLEMIVGIVGAVLLLALILRRVLDGAGLAVLSIAVTATLALPSLAQTPTTFEVGYDNAYTLDEILAVAGGRLPAFDYVSQYENLLGLPLGLLGLVPGLVATAPSAFAIEYLVLLQIATLAGGVAAAWIVAPRRLRWLLPPLVVPVAFLIGSAGVPYYADLPMRFALPTVLLVVLSALGMRRVRGGRMRVPVAVVAGALGGAAAFNNLDYGVPAMLAGLAAVILTGDRVPAGIRSGLVYLAAVPIVPAVYLAAGFVSGRSFSLDRFLFFVSSFGVEGHLNVDMLPFGLHVAFVTLGVVGVVVGVRGARRLSHRNAVLHRAIVFQSTWLILSLVYFSGRSLTPTLVTGSAFLAAVLLALLFVAGFPVLRLLARAGVSSWRLREWTVAIVALLTVAIPIAAWTVFPSVERGAQRMYFVANPRPGTPDYLRPDPSAAVAAIRDRSELMGILTVSGTTWGMRLDVPNAGLFLNPSYLELAAGAAMQCEYLAQIPGDSLLTTETIATTLAGTADCRDVLDFDGQETIRRAALDPETGAEWVVIPRAESTAD